MLQIAVKSMKKEKNIFISKIKIKLYIVLFNKWNNFELESRKLMIAKFTWNYHQPAISYLPKSTQIDIKSNLFE